MLFDVPGWKAPNKTASTSANSHNLSKKRKRSNSTDDTTSKDGSTQKLNSAAMNLEKLVKQLGDGPANQQAPSNKKPKKIVTSNEKPSAQPIPKQTPKQKKTERSSSPTEILSSKATKKPKPQPKEQGPPKKKRKGTQQDTSSIPKDEVASTVKQSHVSTSTQGLTPLQSKMKATLEGARFRYFNEVLYKSESQTAKQMVEEDPELFGEYHAGFRQQVKSWPTNPVSRLAIDLLHLPAKSVIVDLGCGDAALAKQLTPKGYRVISFDLQADGEYVVQADICSKLPLPGSEADQGGVGQIVDVVVCSLSLMSTNWLNCIRESWRILQTGGKLKIAEVTSRIEDIKAFTNAICSLGFKLEKQDDSNTHFLIFDFVKQTRSSPLNEASFKEKLEDRSLLKSCEYKRR